MRIYPLVLTFLLIASSLPAQEASSELRGSWSATAGQNQVFWGAWTAQVSLDKPNTAQGSWTLFSKEGAILLEGTWAAEKARSSWLGSWAARTLQGQSFSGTWTANAPGLSARTLKQMLELTVQKDILGSWRSGGNGGSWRLRGIAPQRGQAR